MLAGLALHTIFGFFAMVVVVGGGAVVVVGAGFVVVVVGGAVVVVSTMLVVVGSAVDVVASGIEDDENPSTPPVGRVEVLGSSRIFAVPESSVNRVSATPTTTTVITNAPIVVSMTLRRCWRISSSLAWRDISVSGLPTGALPRCRLEDF